MLPSYPGFRRHGDLAVQFAVPSQRVVRRILRDINEDEDDNQPRFKAAANLLHPHIKCLARLMSRYRVIVDVLNKNELGVTLFLPPPPCPPPNSTIFSPYTRLKMFQPRLETITEEISAEMGNLQSNQEGDWTTTYQYIPSDQSYLNTEKRHCVYMCWDAHNERTWK
jgi:hypothetical protein